MFCEKRNDRNIPWILDNRRAHPKVKWELQSEYVREKGHEVRDFFRDSEVRDF